MTRIQVRSMDRRRLEHVGPLGEALRTLAADTAEADPTTRLLIVRPQSVDLIDPTPFHADGISSQQALVSLVHSRTKHGPAEVLGLVGRARRGPQGPEEALLFLEWPDLRWWWWRAPMAQGQVQRAHAIVRDARWGDPMPDGLGRWWTRARRARPSREAIEMEAIGVGPVH